MKAYKNLQATELGLQCHEYDSKKELLPNGLSPADLQMLGLEALEERIRTQKVCRNS